jgi:hypothetical protein
MVDFGVSKARSKWHVAMKIPPSTGSGKRSKRKKPLIALQSKGREIVAAISKGR